MSRVSGIYLGCKIPRAVQWFVKISKFYDLGSHGFTPPHPARVITRELGFADLNHQPQESWPLKSGYFEGQNTPAGIKPFHLKVQGFLGYKMILQKIRRWQKASLDDLLNASSHWCWANFSETQVHNSPGKQSISLPRNHESIAETSSMDRFGGPQLTNDICIFSHH